MPVQLIWYGGATPSKGTYENVEVALEAMQGMTVKAFQEGQKEGMILAANTLLAKILDSIQVPSPPPSLPWEPPHKVTGELIRGFRVEIMPDDNVNVVSDTDYSLYLELGTRHMQPRPFVTRAVMDHMDEIADAFFRASGLQKLLR